MTLPFRVWCLPLRESPCFKKKDTFKTQYWTKGLVKMNIFGLEGPDFEQTRTRILSLHGPTRQTLSSADSRVRGVFVLVSGAAGSLVSLNCRYKHNSFFEENKMKRHKLLQCSPPTGNLYVLCVFLRQCFCGSNCIVLIRITVSYSWSIGHTPS